MDPNPDIVSLFIVSVIACFDVKFVLYATWLGGILASVADNQSQTQAFNLLQWYEAPDCPYSSQF